MMQASSTTGSGSRASSAPSASAWAAMPGGKSQDVNVAVTEDRHEC